MYGRGQALNVELFMADDAIRPAQPNQAPLSRDALTDHVPPPLPAEHSEKCSNDLGAELVHSSWLRRQFIVILPEGKSHVDYYGRGIGFESVFVDGFAVKSETSFWWFVPEFRFRLGNRRRGVIKIRVWPWLAVKSFELWVDGQLLYGEGRRID